MPPSIASASAKPLALEAEEGSPVGKPPPAFEEVYETYFDFVWRSVRRLGVYGAAVDDVVQEVFLVVHRRLREFEARSSLKTWIFGITLRVVQHHRRTLRRKPLHGGEGLDQVHEPLERGPHESAAMAEARRVLHEVLDVLGEGKREVFILAELEQMTVPEIAEAVGINLNTAYARLRAARQEFESAVARHRARDRWRLR